MKKKKSRKGGFRDRNSDPKDDVGVRLGDVSGTVEVVVGEHRYCYPARDLQGWVLRVAVSLNMGSLEHILSEMRKTE